ncbi:DUF1971 domain-containing protein [Erythrobacter arachoides]|uniref:DUF1971 domain-containing protein n=1 Tax=Aurantiacibacter arachoides TaxID=1850444 RepID=A0A844ZZI6_9SPHN|nr:DUF1971 domain-containing protein [Aurantiacibacter arachoides]MXO92642.1 DUF1971 domain-containing protein [Aurantiacibacter arachoides]GGD55522.1 hypothetical protein GCM10011411_14450 [Aurantiacibacter arachoides]
MKADLLRNLEPYKRTATFTDSTVPAGLLADHSTKGGIWGLIQVEEGKLRYLVTDPRRVSTNEVLTPDSAPGIVEPTILHRVEPIGAVKFHVEFLRPPLPGRESSVTDKGEGS